MKKQTHNMCRNQAMICTVRTQEYQFHGELLVYAMASAMHSVPAHGRASRPFAFMKMPPDTGLTTHQSALSMYIATAWMAVRNAANRIAKWCGIFLLRNSNHLSLGRANKRRKKYVISIWLPLCGYRLPSSDIYNWIYCGAHCYIVFIVFFCSRSMFCFRFYLCLVSFQDIRTVRQGSRTVESCRCSFLHLFFF